MARVVLLVAAGASLAATVAAILLTRRKSSDRIKVLVASTAAAKLVAVERALNAVVIGRKTDSFVSEQPVGLEETLAGAKNRLQMMVVNEDLPEGQSSPFTYAVAIENGIVLASTSSSTPAPSEVWIDLAVVCVQNLQTGAQAYSTSCGVQIPSQFVGEWLEDGRDGTVGTLIASHQGGDKQDPHALLTGGTFPRARLLEEAVKVAVACLDASEPN